MLNLQNTKSEFKMDMYRIQIRFLQYFNSMGFKSNFQKQTRCDDLLLKDVVEQSKTTVIYRVTIYE